MGNYVTRIYGVVCNLAFSPCTGGQLALAVDGSRAGPLGLSSLRQTKLRIEKNIIIVCAFSQLHKDPVSVEELGHRVSARINGCGRLGDAKQSAPRGAPTPALGAAKVGGAPQKGTSRLPIKRAAATSLHPPLRSYDAVRLFTENPIGLRSTGPDIRAIARR
ncbi:hypothetical protein AAG570_006422 [Ranatra chinensis]|uniref:Ribosomal protein S14 n=1 Tax=Ranatra chinensis TaxID=642074 RepID=A0ABD0ZB04_9HEMI